MPNKKNPRMTGLFQVEIEVLGSKIYHANNYLVVPLSGDIRLSRIMHQNASRMTSETMEQLKALCLEAANNWATTHGYKVDPYDSFWLPGKYCFGMIAYPAED